MSGQTKIKPQDAVIFQKIRTERPNEKQRQFFLCTKRNILYGGARGGGKSWALRRKAILLAIKYDGIKILLLRKTYPELKANHILTMQTELNGYAQYKSTDNAFIFPNGSRIQLGYCDTEKDVLRYQGHEYEVIMFDEATNFTEYQLNFLTSCARTTRNDFTPRIYYTANPGGVGHSYIKDLFINRVYKNGENPDDYEFIPALVFDNKVLMENDPNYVKRLESLPEDLRAAHLYGDWDAFAGQYFTEFNRNIHVVEPFTIPSDWKRFRTMDYGLDMLACYYVALSPSGKSYFYKEVYQSDLIISDAAKAILAVQNETIIDTFAPGDLWNRRQETGASAAELFYKNGLPLTKAINNRVQGWLNVKEALKPKINEFGEQEPKMFIFSTCSNLIRCLPQLQHDKKNPDDVANEPHELTHGPDAVRYYYSGRAEERAQEIPQETYDEYDSFINYGR